MAHRGSMSNPLEPFPEEMIRSVSTTAQLIKERQGTVEADRFVMVQTGMTQEQVLQMEDAIVAREKAEKKWGLGGMR
jgi:hypothetical protein